MALRYLNLDKPNYIPTYQPLNPQMLSQVDASIQQQGATAQQYKRSQLDAASQAYVQGISNLNEEDQQFARERFEQTKQKLGEIASNVGARSMMPFVDEEVASLTKDLGMHKKASQMKAQAMEVLEESPAPTAVRNYVLREGIGVKYDEETGQATGIQGGYSSSELNIAKNWEDFSDFLNKFSGSRKEQSSQTTFGQTNYQETLANGDVLNYREELSGIGFGDAHIENMNALLNDPKMREQLSLYANAIIGEDNPDIRTTEGGIIERDFYVRQRDTKSNKFVKPDGHTTDNPNEAKVIKETKEFASKEAMAASIIAEPYSMKDSGLKSKFITTKSIERASGSSGSLGNDPLFTTSQSVKVAEMDSEKYLNGLYEQRETIITQESEVLGRLKSTANQIFGDVGSNVTVEEVQGKIQISYSPQEGGNAQRTILHGEEEILNHFTAQQETLEPNSSEYLRVEQSKQAVLQKVGAMNEMLNRKNVLSIQLADAQNYTQNKLNEIYKDTPGYLDLLEFSPNGTVSINDQAFAQQAIQNPDKFDKGRLPDSIPVQGAQDMNNGEIRVIDSTQLLSAEDPLLAGNKVDTKKITELSSILTKEGLNGKLVIRKREGGFEYFKGGTLLKDMVSNAKDIQQKMVDDLRDAGEHKEYIGVRLIPGIDKYDHVINSLEQNKGLTAENSSMNFLKGDGSELTDDDQEEIRQSDFQAHSIVLIDGEPKIIGSFIKDGIVVEGLERVIAGGEEAESMAQYLYGDKYQLGLGVAALNRMMPELMDGSLQVPLSVQAQRSILGGYDAGKPLYIEHKVTRNRNGEKSYFKITDSDGNFAGEATNAYTIQGVLLSLVTE